MHEKAEKDNSGARLDSEYAKDWWVGRVVSSVSNGEDRGSRRMGIDATALGRVGWSTIAGNLEGINGVVHYMKTNLGKGEERG